jgi:hypothetical protein
MRNFLGGSAFGATGIPDNPTQTGGFGFIFTKLFIFVAPKLGYGM